MKPAVQATNGHTQGSLQRTSKVGDPPPSSLKGGREAIHRHSY